MKKLVITGGCGFIGSNLLRVLNNSGLYDITLFDNLSRGKLSHVNDLGSYRFFDGDIRDNTALTECFRGMDAVVHLAAYGSVVESVSDPEENFDINVRGTFNVLNACRGAGVQRLVFASTGGALIGNAIPPVDEKSLPRPISPYGASKLAGEGYCSAFAGAYGMDIIALRFANVIGPMSWHKNGAVTKFFKALMSDEPIEIYGDGTATRDYLYVEDLCTGISLALQSSLSGFHTLHLASAREVSVSELARIAASVASKPDHSLLYRTKRAGEVERNFANYERAREALGFTPKYSLEEAMELTWHWMQEQS